jgi:hypothetical protein
MREIADELILLALRRRKIIPSAQVERLLSRLRIRESGRAD